jgi:hydroxymethylglutaryl-CoA lyase
MNDRVEIVEVSPRDGLQNEREVVSTADKVRLVEDLVAAGVRRMEVTSFVHPERVPQMADAEQVMQAVPRRDDVSYIGLVLNLRGAVRAAAAGVDEINYVLPATDTFGQRNQGVTTRQALDALVPIAALAREEGMALSVTVAVSFGCPYEGEVPPARVAEVAREVVAAGIDELALADTLGSAVPREVTERVQAVGHSEPRCACTCTRPATRASRTRSRPSRPA